MCILIPCYSCWRTDQQCISCVFDVKNLGPGVKPARQDASLSLGLTNNPISFNDERRAKRFLSL